MAANLNPQIANAKLMARYAVAFNIGADILGKGSRAIDKYLGAEQLSGDTVNVPIWDSGEIFDNMDLTGKDLSVERGYVPVTVSPLVSASTLTVEDLTLSVKNPEHMVKRVVKQADEANRRAFRTLISQSQAKACTATPPTGQSLSDNIRFNMFSANATTTGSKLGGKTYGCTHPMTWNRLAASLATNFAPNDKLGKELYTNELGDFMGFSWSKGSEMTTVTGLDATAFGNITLTNGQASFNYTTDPATVAGATFAAGDWFTPFTIPGVYNCDAIGLRTGELKTFHAYYGEDGSWYLSTPVFFNGSRQNAWYAGMSGANKTPGMTQTTAATPGNVLTVGVMYLSPAVLWKEADFLVAVKGLEKFYGCDSFTVPTEYKERGILPLRGTVFTDPVKASTLFRVDVLMGTAMYQGISASSVYIPA